MDKEVISKSVSKRLAVQNKDKRPESCDKCKFKPECKRPDRIDNAYGGLECATKWNKQPTESKHDQEREAFKIVTEPIEVIELLVSGLRQNQIIDRKLFEWFKVEIEHTKSSQQKAQAEIEELKKQRDRYWNALENEEQVTLKLSSRIKELEQQIADMKYEKDFH